MDLIEKQAEEIQIKVRKFLKEYPMAGSSLAFVEGYKLGFKEASQWNSPDKTETIWEELDRFIDSIKAEIRDDNPDQSAIDFWLFKIERRIKILKDEIEILNNK